MLEQAFGRMDALEKRMTFQFTLHCTPNHHSPKLDVLPKTCLQIILAAKWLLVQHSSTVRTPSNCDDLCLLFCLILILLYAIIVISNQPTKLCSWQAIYHGFVCVSYFTPIFGALLADLLLGKFKTIVYISVLYVLGHILKTIAAIPTLGVPPV